MQAPRTIDITPSPRVLRLLGLIDLQPWQCLAELVDNAIDAFLTGRETGQGAMFPRVDIEISSREEIHAGRGKITIRDNAFGMDPERLTNAVRAGYSGNNPVDKLGLFGMGFNIATARLGGCTEIWTTKTDSTDWHGVRIDFQEIEASGNFRIPMLTRPKTPQEHQGHGTEIIVSKLDQERALYVRTPGGSRTTRDRLSRTYSKIIREIGLTAVFLGQPLTARDFCVWDRSRTVETGSRFGQVPAQLPISANFGQRNYCTECWVWLLQDDVVCPACNTDNSIQQRTRELTGWIGIQRFFDTRDYGVDLIRNGRIIEERSKHFFSWESESGESTPEYPIDQTYWGGRIVGELNCDFVPLSSYQKDSFDKSSREWQLIVEAVRGNGPILQHLRKSYGFEGDNVSPLARLHAGFRRGQPAGLRWLVPAGPDGKGINVPPQEWATRFWAGDPEYQSDAKWYEAVLLATEVNARNRSRPLPPDITGTGLFDPQPEPGAAQESDAVGRGAESGVNSPTSHRDYEQDANLTFEAVLPELSGSPPIQVTTQRLTRGQLPSGLHIQVVPVGNNLDIVYDPSHEFFARSLILPVDCLLQELAFQFKQRSNATLADWPISRVTYELRQRYYPSTLLSIDEIRSEANVLLNELVEHYTEALSAISPLPPDELTDTEIRELAAIVARQERAGTDRVKEIITNGTYPRYMGHNRVLKLIERRPELALDGQFFSLSYSDVDVQLRPDILQQVDVALKDLLWAVDPSQSSGAGAEWRSLLARAEASARLLSIWRV